MNTNNTATFLTYKEFEEKYKPIDNQFNPKAPLNGKLFDVIGFSRIAPFSLRNRLLWTVIKSTEYDPISREEITQTQIYPGIVSMTSVLGYIVTEISYEYGSNIIVNV